MISVPAAPCPPIVQPLKTVLVVLLVELLVELLVLVVELVVELLVLLLVVGPSQKQRRRLMGSRPRMDPQSPPPGPANVQQSLPV